MDFRTFKTGDPFISLEEFMLLPESSFKADERRPWGVSAQGPEWVKRYQVAKESWEKYGTNPPMNVDVAVLVNGHGTHFPSLTDDHRFKMSWLPKQKLVQYEDGNGPFFALERKDPVSYWPGDGKGIELRKVSLSLIDKTLWWRSIFILDNQENVA